MLNKESGHTTLLGICIAIVLGVFLTPIILPILEKGILWQDIVLTVGGFVFSLALIPSIMRGSRYPRLTSIPTAITLTSGLAVYITLDLYLTALSTSLTAICWWILVIRGVNND